MQRAFLQRSVATLKLVRSERLSLVAPRGSLNTVVATTSWAETGLSHSAFSTTATTTEPLPPRFAAVQHAHAYEQAMAGLHGNQLELAKMEGYGKDDPPFDPFALEDELDRLWEEAQARADTQTTPDAKKTIVDTKKSPTGAAANLPEEIADEEDDGSFDVSDEMDDTGHGDADSDDLSSIYNNDGSLRRKKSQLAMLRAGYPSGGLFAVLSLAGTQHKVTTDDVLIVNLLKPVSKFKVGSIHTFKDEDILLLSSSHYTLVGMPYVQGAEIDVLVEEVTKDAKVVVFKRRRKKHSKRKNGFRRDVTMLRILDIRPPEAYADQYYVPRIEANPSETTEEDDEMAAA